MNTRPLRAISSLFLLATLACNPTEPGVTTETTSDTSGDTTPDTTTGTTGGSSTGEPTTDTPTTSGDSDSVTGTTGDTTGSTGPVTGDESSSTAVLTTEDLNTTGDDTTSDPPDPVSFAECRAGDASMCPAQDPACLVVDGPGGFNPDGSFFVQWTYCSRECDSDSDCASELPGGNAKPLCVPKGPNDVKVCVLDCSFGKQCPDALECAGDDTCGTRFCDCEGNGCQDFLCTGE